MRLRFEEWLVRKGLTPEKVVESGVTNEVSLLAMADRLGVVPPADLEEYRTLWQNIAKEGEESTQAKGAGNKADQAAEVPEETTTVKKSKTGARTARRRTSSRKKTNIKDEEK